MWVILPRDFIMKNRDTFIKITFDVIKETKSNRYSIMVSGYFQKEENWQKIVVRKQIQFWGRLIEKDLPKFDYTNKIVKKLWIDELLKIKKYLLKFYNFWIAWREVEIESSTIFGNTSKITIYKNKKREWINLILASLEEENKNIFLTLWLEDADLLLQIIDYILKKQISEDITNNLKVREKYSNEFTKK